MEAEKTFDRNQTFMCKKLAVRYKKYRPTFPEELYTRILEYMKQKVKVRKCDCNIAFLSVIVCANIVLCLV